MARVDKYRHIWINSIFVNPGGLMRVEKYVHTRSCPLASHRSQHIIGGALYCVEQHHSTCDSATCCCHCTQHCHVLIQYTRHMQQLLKHG
jgi:hypothetical protein